MKVGLGWELIFYYLFLIYFFFYFYKNLDGSLFFFFGYFGYFGYSFKKDFYLLQIAIDFFIIGISYVWQLILFLSDFMSK